MPETSRPETSQPETSQPFTPSSTAGHLLGLLVQSPDLDALLTKLAHLAGEVVTPAAVCGITIRRDGRPFSPAVSDSLAAQLDEIQYVTDEGPCLDALRGGSVVVVDDLSHEDRWNQYRPAAIAYGVVSSLSLPLIVDGERLGALNLYSTTATAFTGPLREQAEGFAVQAIDALTLTMRQVRQAQMQDQLAQAVVSSSVIDQAIGILMAEQRCTAAAAFDLLRQASQNRNRKLRDIAGDLITRVSGAPPQPRPAFRAAAEGPPPPKEQ
ncbi:GAF and ANTAR domain-containing protein [Actinoplanes sp. NPDC051343]|uniref:GAF and ANTAR domain-containing protein n=1 Tax=Actinoplanes sp. NPDC051343 TaxID=3363906 RepID=UPI0037AE0B55